MAGARWFVVDEPEGGEWPVVECLLVGSLNHTSQMCDKLSLGGEVNWFLNPSGLSRL